MKILITGATGMVGSEAVRQAISDQDIKKITALVRRPLDIQNPKLTVITHGDFLDYSGLIDVFQDHDACLWCLGISQTKVSKEAYHTITYDYAIAAAKAIEQSNPDCTFIFVSGMGADPTMKSRTLFARVKGKTENDLQKLSIKNLYIVRPGGIQPVQKNKNASWQEKMLSPFLPLLRLLVPSLVINSVELAQAILHIVKHGSDKTVLENKDLLHIIP
ncbi:NAD(P)H-binding protein [Candidatus Latescibacterota bacterium]